MASSDKIKPWYSALSFGSKTQTVENFYNPSQLAWTSILENNWETINQEVSHFIEHNEGELGSFYADQKKWKSFGLFAWGVCLSKGRVLHFTNTLAILKQVPDVVTIMVGVMEPNSVIKPHYGDTDAVYRCHLGLTVPDKFPAIGLQVGDDKMGWEQGKTLVFNDAKFHSTWNHTPHRRVVLIIDVVKPEFKGKKINICAVVLTSLALQKVSQKLNFIPSFLLYPVRLLFPFMYLAIWGYLYIKKNNAVFLLSK